MISRRSSMVMMMMLLLHQMMIVEAFSCISSIPRYVSASSASSASIAPRRDQYIPKARDVAVDDDRIGDVEKRFRSWFRGEFDNAEQVSQVNSLCWPLSFKPGVNDGWWRDWCCLGERRTSSRSRGRGVRRPWADTLSSWSTWSTSWQLRRFRVLHW